MAQQLSPVEAVRRYLRSILNAQQLAELDQILSGIDTNTDPPADTLLQKGGSEDPARLGRDGYNQIDGGLGPSGGLDRRRKLGKDAVPGTGPTDAGPERPEYPTVTGRALPLDRLPGADRWRKLAGDDPSSFSGRPRPGGGMDPIDVRQGASHAARWGGKLDGFAHDSIAADQALRRRLRAAGHPLGDHGGPGAAHRYAASVGLGYLMALDSAPRPSSDVDAPLDAIAHIGELSYAGRTIHSSPRPPAGQGMACDSGGDPLSLGNVFPELAARFAIQEASEHRAFVVTNPASRRADERTLGRRSRAPAAMAMDTATASRAPSIAAVFGADFAATLDKIGVVSR